MICSRFGILFYFREKRLLLLEKEKEKKNQQKYRTHLRSRMILCKIDGVTAPGIAGDTTLSSSSNSVRNSLSQSITNPLTLLSMYLLRETALIFLSQEQPHALSNVFHTTRSGNTLEERSVCVKVKKSLT